MIKGLSTAGMCLTIISCTTLSTLLPERDKTPLTPQGKMNVCLLQESQRRIARGNTGDLGVAAAEVARYCVRQLDLEDEGLDEQAALNARYFLESFSAEPGRN